MLYKVILKFTFNLLIFTFVLCLFFIKSARCTGHVQIKIWSDKTEFLTREPISIRYEVKNVGNSPAVMIFHALKGYFKIKDKRGKVYPNTLSFSYGFACDTLKPNEIFEGSEGIDSRYGIVQPGEYICYLESPKWGDTPSAKSNEIKIKVKDSEGEEKKALDMFLEAEKLKYARGKDGKKDLKKRDVGFQKYQELVDKYPNSIYAPQALQAAIGIYKYSVNMEEMRKVIQLCLRLIENYPDSYSFGDVSCDLIDIYKALKDKQGAIKTLKELIQKHPNSKISAEAEIRLKQIEKWEF
jgi:tetratricopeptide (TPR) repeat protein